LAPLIMKKNDFLAPLLFITGRKGDVLAGARRA